MNNVKKPDTEKEEKDLPKDRVDLFPVFKVLYDLILEFEKAHAQFPKVYKYSTGTALAGSLLQL